LVDSFKLNIEANHATLAGHTFHHELEFAAANGILGSIDANRGDLLLGWDTDQFPTDLYDTTLAMYVLLRYGGFKTGGLNFDAKIRRQSIDADDILHAHVGSMDACARGLLMAAKIIEDGKLKGIVDQRYAKWKEPQNQAMLSGKETLDSIAARVLSSGLDPQPASGRQERLENLVNSYI
jgi:xylose isomerase